MSQYQPLVSVIVPIYKVEKYLDQCLDTICGQTYSELQIILVDDGSPDSCGKICDDRAAIDPRIQVIHKSNGGLSDARNAGMEFTTGRFLFFVDSDDYLDLRTIELLVKEAERTGADIVMAGTRPFLDGQSCSPAPLCEKSILLDRSEAMRRFARDGWGAWGKLYRREIHDGIRFPCGKIHEDEAIMFQILDRCQTVSILTDELYYYRKRTDSITSVPYSVRKMDWLYAWANNVEHVGKADPELYLRCVSKLWTVMLYNLDHLIGQCGYGQELDDIKTLAKRYGKDIRNNPYVTRNAKLRLQVLRLSNIHDPKCLYARCYSMMGRIRR